MSEQALSFRSVDRPARRAGPVERWTRARVRAHLAGLRAGAVTLVDGDERQRFGPADAEREATLFVEDPAFYRAVSLGGSLGGAESYFDGHWRSDDLSGLLRILAADAATWNELDSGAARWRRPALALLHALRRNTRRGSRRNIAAHYDLGNEFFSLFLDPTLTYSAGVFEHPEASMEEASIAKYERVCARLALAPGDRVLEIGSGWGGFALHAASRHGCHVTTCTLSRRQHEEATRRVREAGLANRIEVQLRDYRDLQGRYDKLVSIEMIEAVGHQNLDSFLRVCGERLRPGGSLCLQAITVPDRDYETHLRCVDFIKRHVFPGGDLVSVGAVQAAATRSSDLQLSHLEELTPHYAETLRRWRARLLENRSALTGLGLGGSFQRFWEFYLCYCEAGFEEEITGLVQAVFRKPALRGGWRGEA